jgi:hypothetical protein
MQITATFGFSEPALREKKLFPGLNEFPNPATDLSVRSVVSLADKETNLEASSSYQRRFKINGAYDFEKWGENGDPLNKARSRNLSHWFVAGYGVSRVLPESAYKPQLTQPAIDRLEPVLNMKAPQITSIGFINYFEDEKTRKLFNRILQDIIKKKKLIDDLENVELTGQGGVRKSGDLLERERFVQKIGNMKQKLPAIALAHGYQSMIAWIADLVGHILLDTKGEIEPEDMSGLVLIDELDLYLHPAWQVSVVSTLKQIFKKMQFIVTTHSPLVLASVPAVSVVYLEDKEGDIVRKPLSDKQVFDPRLLTISDLYEQYFDMDDIYPTVEGKASRDFMLIGSDPFRDEQEEERLKEAKKELDHAGIRISYPEVKRKDR